MKIKKELTYFFLISFAWMWLLNLPRVLTSFDVMEMPPFLYGMLGYLAVFAPGIAAFTLTGISRLRPGFRRTGKKTRKTTSDMPVWIRAASGRIQPMMIFPGARMSDPCSTISWSTSILKW